MGDAMNEAPERIWTASTTGRCHVGFDTPSANYKTEYIRADLYGAQTAERDSIDAAWSERVALVTAEIADLRAERDNLADKLALEKALTDGAHKRAKAAEAQVAKLVEAIRAAHDALWELNPNNYTHDEVCRLNDASVEAILTLAPLIGDMHGKTPEWWAERAAALSAVKREAGE